MIIYSKINKFLFVVFLMTYLGTTSSVYAQYGFATETYYNKQWSVQDVPVGYPYAKYDFYGNWIGNYQLVNHAEWHSSSGGQYVTRWGPNGWYTEWISGYYYWFTWINYERRVS